MLSLWKVPFAPSFRRNSPNYDAATLLDLNQSQTFSAQDDTDTGDMTDINQWRRKIQPTQSRAHLSAVDHEESPAESYSSPATPRKKLRPKLSSYFSHYMPNAAHAKPVSPPNVDHTAQAERPSVSLSTHRFIETCNPEPERLMDSVMRELLVEPYHALDPTHNSSLMMIFEAHRFLRDQNEALAERLQTEVSGRDAAELESDRAEQRWQIEKEEYKKEIKRLELIIAKGKRGLAEVVRARQDSVLRRGYQEPAADGLNDQKETVFEFLERTKAEDDDARRSQRGN